MPIGILSAAVGATSIYSWISEEAQRALPAAQRGLETMAKRRVQYEEQTRKYEAELPAYHARAKADRKSPGRLTPMAEPTKRHRFLAAGFYNGMIAPLTRFPVKGILWYQGNGDQRTPDTYTDALKTLITSWRDAWRLPEALFLIVQLENYDPVKSKGLDPAVWTDVMARLRAAQERALVLPHTAMVVACDVGDPSFVHPRDKKTIGDRLARAALNLTYGKDVEYRGPQLTGLRLDGGQVVLQVQTRDGKLVSKSGPSPAGFELAGADGKFARADATLSGGQVTVSSVSIPEPKAIRYAWANNPEMSLYNSDGLPLPPFVRENLPSATHP